MKDKRVKSAVTMVIIGILPVIYLGLLLANAFEDGCNLLTAFSWISENPFCIEICDSTAKTVFVVLFIYGIAVLYFLSDLKNYRNGEEHGSAKWDEPANINRKYTDRHSKFENKILTQNVSIGFDGHKHKRNLNTAVVGGSGAGKTKFIIQPNILQCSTSYVILDPKGESLEENGNLLKAKGYDIRILNLKEPMKSHSYNPFAFIEGDDDVQKVATILMRATTPKESRSNDPYWEQQAEVLLKAFMFYLHYEAPDYEQNFSFLLEMLREAQVAEGKEEEKSVIDDLFDELEQREPNHIAVKYYRDVRPVPGRTYNTIRSTLTGRLEKFNLESIANITSSNDLDFISLGTKKTALFLVIPDNDKSYNFLISILYLQMFQQLEDYADSLPGKLLPIHVQFLMDEFANVALPDDFEQTLSVARSRGFSFTIILQNLSQLKFHFEKQWEGIMGNCDSFVYLGGNEQSSHKYVSELLGKETIDLNSFGKSRGRNGSYTTNYQKAGRELLTPDEVRMLENEYALLFIRGSRPVIDKKYNVWEHPNAKYTMLKGGEPYDNEGLRLKSELSSFDVDELDPQDIADENIPVIDLDKFIGDIEKEIEKIKNENYL